jgi:hypothetical protein
MPGHRSLLQLLLLLLLRVVWHVLLLHMRLSSYHCTAQRHLRGAKQALRGALVAGMGWWREHR